MTNFRALAAIILMLLSVPALSQVGYTEGYRFLKAVRERDGATVDSITSNPSSTAVNYREPSNGEGALHILVRGRDLNWLTFMLSRRARPNIQSSDGTTPLMLAAQLGWRDGVERLLARGASVNLANNRGETPLILAVQRYDAAIVRLLMAEGADPEHTDSVAGNSALDYARQDPRGATVLRTMEDPANRPNTARRQQGPVGPTQP